MSYFTVYDPSTGEIKRSGWCPDGDENLQVGAGESLLLAPSDGSKHWVSEGRVVGRKRVYAEFDKTEIAADGVEVATLSGLPDPFTLYVDGVETVVTGGELELSVTTPGEYHVKVRNPIYEFKRWVVEGV